MEQQINHNIIQSAIDTNIQVCECVSTQHESIAYRLCPLNLNNISKANNKKSCKCGSDTHFRTNYKYCRLNKRFVQNAEVNRIRSLEDVDDLINSQINIHQNCQYNE